MWLSQLFIENPINFEKRCRSRIITGILFALLGAAALGMAFISKSHVFVLYLEPGYREYIPGFYGGTGVGLMAAGIITVMRNMLGLHRVYGDDPALYRYSGERIHQPDRIQNPDGSDRVLWGDPGDIPPDAAEGHVNHGRSGLQ